MNKFQESDYSRVTIVNNTVLYTWKMLREQILEVLTKHTYKKVTMWGDKLVNLIVATISQYICVWNHHITCLKFIQSYMSIISL